MEIKIDPEVRDLLPVPTDEERALLRDSLQREGCREALVVWKEEGILLDGHNRLGLCREIGIEFETREVSLPDRDAALLWVIDNQLARRNLTPRDVQEYRGRRYKLLARSHGDPSRLDPSSQNENLGKTRDRVAAELGVSGSTISRAAKIVDWLDAIRDRVGPERRADVRRATAPLSEAELEELAARDDVATIEGINAFAAECAERRRPKPSTPPGDERPLVTRSVKDVRLTVDTTTGEETIEAWLLVCSHETPAPRGVAWKGSLDKHQKTAPCYQCGSGTRTPYERRRAEDAWISAWDEAAADERRAALREVCRHGIALAGMTPHDKRAPGVRRDLLGAAERAGLLAVARKESAA